MTSTTNINQIEKSQNGNSGSSISWYNQIRASRNNSTVSSPINNKKQFQTEDLKDSVIPRKLENWNFEISDNVNINDNSNANFILGTDNDNDNDNNDKKTSLLDLTRSKVSSSSNSISSLNNNDDIFDDDNNREIEKEKRKDKHVDESIQMPINNGRRRVSVIPDTFNNINSQKLDERNRQTSIESATGTISDISLTDEELTDTDPFKGNKYEIQTMDHSNNDGNIDSPKIKLHDEINLESIQVPMSFALKTNKVKSDKKKLNKNNSSIKRRRKKNHLLSNNNNHSSQSQVRSKSPLRRSHFPEISSDSEPQLYTHYNDNSNDRNHIKNHSLSSTSNSTKVSDSSNKNEEINNDINNNTLIVLPGSKYQYSSGNIDDEKSQLISISNSEQLKRLKKLEQGQILETSDESTDYCSTDGSSIVYDKKIENHDNETLYDSDTTENRTGTDTEIETNTDYNIIPYRGSRSTVDLEHYLSDGFISDNYHNNGTSSNSYLNNNKLTGFESLENINDQLSSIDDDGSTTSYASSKRIFRSNGGLDRQLQLINKSLYDKKGKNPEILNTSSMIKDSNNKRLNNSKQSIIIDTNKEILPTSIYSPSPLVENTRIRALETAIYRLETEKEEYINSEINLISKFHNSIKNIFGMEGLQKFINAEIKLKSNNDNNRSNINNKIEINEQDNNRLISSNKSISQWIFKSSLNTYDDNEDTITPNSNKLSISDLTINQESNIRNSIDDLDAIYIKQMDNKIIDKQMNEVAINNNIESENRSKNNNVNNNKLNTNSNNRKRSRTSTPVNNKRITTPIKFKDQNIKLFLNRLDGLRNEIKSLKEDKINNSNNDRNNLSSFGNLNNNTISLINPSIQLNYENEIMELRLENSKLKLIYQEYTNLKEDYEKLLEDNQQLRYAGVHLQCASKLATEAYNNELQALNEHIEHLKSSSNENVNIIIENEKQELNYLKHNNDNNELLINNSESPFKTPVRQDSLTINQVSLPLLIQIESHEDINNNDNENNNNNNNNTLNPNEIESVPPTPELKYNGLIDDLKIEITRLNNELNNRDKYHLLVKQDLESIIDKLRLENVDILDELKRKSVSSDNKSNLTIPNINFNDNSNDSKNELLINENQKLRLKLEEIINELEINNELHAKDMADLHRKASIRLTNIQKSNEETIRILTQEKDHLIKQINELNLKLNNN